VKLHWQRIKRQWCMNRPRHERLQQQSLTVQPIPFGGVRNLPEVLNMRELGPKQWSAREQKHAKKEELPNHSPAASRYLSMWNV